MFQRIRTSARLRALDLRGRLSRGRDPLIPPRGLAVAGHGDFAEAGDRFVSEARELAGLQPDERVLDVGCGTGLLARPLARYLTAAGSYDGFDVDREAIGWLRRRYPRHAPGFNFRVADVFDARRNPLGAHAIADYPFPFPDDAFDVVVSESALTRMLEAEAAHTIAECARVLAPGGRLVVGMFVLDGPAREALAAGRAGLPFLDPGGHVAVVSEDLPEEAVAFSEDWLRGRADAGGLTLAHLRPGTWRGGGEAAGFADVVVFAAS